MILSFLEGNSTKKERRACFSDPVYSIVIVYSLVPYKYRFAANLKPVK